MAYLAEIQIAVRGARELRGLQTQLDKSAQAVDRLNRDIQTLSEGGIPRSINNLSRLVADAASSFNDVALGTKEATDAARDYVRVTDELNTGLQERLALLRQVREEERKARLAASGIREVTQYAGPIGPGAASSVLGGQSVPVEERIRRTLDARKDELELQRALLALEERSAQIANEKLQAQGELAALTARSVNAAKFQAVQTPAQLALPAFTERGLQLLDDSVRVNASSLRIERALNGERQRGVRFLEKQTEEERRQLELGILGARTNALPGTGRARGAVPAGGFPTAGPMLSPGFRGMQRRVGKFGENLALGAGFPLLFGGGAGSVLGSIAGSFVGSGFGGQILGGAIGQVLDQALLKIRDIGTAIKELDFSSLVESGIRFTKEIQAQLDLLLQVGDAVTAQKILSQEVARETGTLPGVTEDVANSVNILNDSWRKTINAIGTTVGIIASPLAVAIAGILEVVNLIFKGVNQIFSLLGKGIKTAAEFVIQLIGGKDALEFINQGIAQLNSGLSEAVATAAEFRNTLNQTVVRTSIDLTAAQALTPGLTSEDKLINIRVEKQRQLNQLYQDEADARIKIRSENAKATQEVIDGLIKQNEFAFKNKRELVEITAERQITTEIQREQVRLADEEARAAEKAARELERQRKEMERMAELRRRQLDDAQRSFVLAKADIDIITSNTKESELQAKYDKIRIERMYTYTDLLKNAASEEEREALAATMFLKILAARIQQDKDLLDIQKQQTAELYAQLDASNLLNPQLSKRLQRGFAEPSVGVMGFTSGLDLDPNNKATQKMNEMKQRLEELSDPINMAAQGAVGIGNAFSTAFQGIITGTQSTQEALSNFFKGVGDAFVSMATEIIAQMVVMFAFKQLLGLFGGGGSGGLFSGAGPYQLPSGGGFMEGFTGANVFAEGGFVTGPTRALIGEGGEPEYVIPASKMGTALARYASGVRGNGVISGAVSDNRAFLDSLTTGIGAAVDSASDDPAAATAATRASIRESERFQENRMQILNQQSALERRYERERIEQMASTPGNLNIRYESQVINNVEYVTREQAERMAAQSALRGRELAIGSLQNSVKTRKRVGMA